MTLISRLSIAVAALLCAASVAGAQTTIRLASPAPLGSVWHKALKQFEADVRTATGGRVVVRVIGAAQDDEATMISNMRIGRQQAASITAVGLASVDDAFNVFTIPMFFSTYEEYRAVRAKMEPVVKQKLEAKGLVLLNWGDTGWVYLFAKNPTPNVDELKKQRLYTSAGDDRFVQLYKANGFNPRPLPFSEVQSGLMTGLLDAVPSTPLATLAFQWYRNVPHMLDIGLGPLAGATVVDAKTWGTISEADRTQVLAVAKKIQDGLEKDVPAQDDQAKAEMIKRGLKVTHPRRRRGQGLPRHGRQVRDVDARQHRARRRLRPGHARAGRLPQDARQQVTLAADAPAEARGVDEHGPLQRAEHALSVLALALLTLLPIAEIVLRRFDSGIPGGTPFVQHLTLVVALLGGALAARDDRLLALATGSLLPAGPWAVAAKGLAGFVGATVAAMLARSGIDVVRLEREAGRMITEGVPVWAFQVLLPLGFAVLAWRIVRTTYKSHPAAGVAAAVGAVLGIYLGAGLPFNWADPFSPVLAEAAQPTLLPGGPGVLQLVAAGTLRRARWPAPRSSRSSAAPRRSCSCPRTCRPRPS